MARIEFHKVSRYVKGTLISGINDSVTSMDYEPDDNTGDPPAAPFKIQLKAFDNVNLETVRVSAVQADTPSAGQYRFTISRGEDGTTATTHNAGTLVTQYASAETISELHDFIDALYENFRLIGGDVDNGIFYRDNRLLVTAQSPADMTVKARAGAAIVSGHPAFLKADFTTPEFTVPTTARIDIVQMDREANITIKEGTDEAGPSAPTVDADNIVLAEVSLTSATGSITNGIITDKRDQYYR